MYDILQLNDMVVPELQDIAEQLSIPNHKKLDKQGLVYKILDKQAIMNAANKNEEEEKPKRKRIIKGASSNEEGPEIGVEKHKAEPKHAKKPEPVVDKRKHIKKIEEEDDEEE